MSLTDDTLCKDGHWRNRATERDFTQPIVFAHYYEKLTAWKELLRIAKAFYLQCLATTPLLKTGWRKPLAEATAFVYSKQKRKCPPFSFQGLRRKYQYIVLYLSSLVSV